MRYDIEIQPQSIGLAFVPNGHEIPNSTIPVLYTNVNETNIIPSDLVEIELASNFKSYLNAPIIESNSLSFNTDSNKLLITNIVGFSKVTGTKTPLFFKHVIKHENGRVLDQSVRLFNELNTEIDRGLYVVTSGVSVDNKSLTYIYTNYIDNSILFVEYSDNEKVYREMLRLEPVFKDIGKYQYDTTYTPGTFEFKVEPANSGTSYLVTTQYNGNKYIASKRDFGFVTHPVSQMSDGWYLRFENMTFKSPGVSGTTITYHMSEYDIYLAQNPGVYKSYTEQISKILNKRYIKTQTPPSIDRISNVDIFIRDRYTNELVFAFTTNTSSDKINTPVTGIIWTHVDDYNYDGVFKLPIEIDATYYNAYVSYDVDNIFYELKVLDLNSLDSAHSKMIGVYITPYIEADDTTINNIYYAYIGIEDSRQAQDKYKDNGAGFDSKASYVEFLSNNSCFNICYTSISIDKLYSLLDILACGSADGGLSNKYSISQSDADIFKKDILDGGIKMQLNDVAYAYIDSNIYSNSPDKDAEYNKFVGDILSKNMNASSSIILKQGIVG